MSVHIIGGGISGLGLAWILSRRGIPVTLIESQPQLGGNASWVKLNGFDVDCFYHIITGRDRCLLGLLKELGIEDRVFAVKARMGFYRKGTTYPISSPAEFLSFPAISPWRRMRMAYCLMRSITTRGYKKLDSLTAKAWLSELCGRENYEQLWKPVMRSKFGSSTDEIAATDMWFRINRISSLSSRRAEKGTYYIKGGLRVLFEALEKRLKEKNVSIIKNTAVLGLDVDGTKVRALKLSSLEELRCERAVFTGSVPDYVRLLPQSCSGYAENLKMIRYLNNVTLILLLKERYSSFYQLNIGEDGFPFTGIIGAEILYPPAEFGGGHVLYISKYFSGNSDYLDMSADGLLERYLPYLKMICPGFERSWILAKQVVAKRDVEAMHTLNYSKLIPGIRTPLENLFLLSTAQIYPEPTVLDACLQYGARFADKINA